MDYWNNLLPNFVYNLNYENLILNTEAEIRKLLQFSNLNWSDNCLNFHKNKNQSRLLVIYRLEIKFIVVQ